MLPPITQVVPPWTCRSEAPGEPAIQSHRPGMDNMLDAADVQRAPRNDRVRSGAMPPKECFARSPHLKYGVSPLLMAALDLGKATAKIQGAFPRPPLERIHIFPVAFRAVLLQPIQKGAVPLPEMGNRAYIADRSREDDLGIPAGQAQPDETSLPLSPRIADVLKSRRSFARMTKNAGPIATFVGTAR